MVARSRGTWIVLQVAALLLTLALWDVLLLKRWLEAPIYVVAIVAGLFLVLLAARRLARSIAAPRRSAVQRHLAALDRPALSLIVFFLVLLLAFHWGYRRAASDGREYFVQVRSLVMDRDLDLSNENATFGVRGTAAIYPFGAPLLWSPLFVAAHGWLGVRNALGADYPRDGYFNPYQRAVGLGSLLYGCLGIVLLFRIAADLVGRRLAAAAAILTVAGSFLIWYFVIDPSMPHAVSLFAVALFVYQWYRSRSRRTAFGWALLGGAAGLMTIVRWQNLGFVVLLLPDLVRLAQQSWRSVSARMGALRATLALSASFLLAVSPQLLFWKATRGGWFAAPAGEHAVSWTSVRDVLFTPDHGLFTWSPLLLFAVLGGVLLARRDRALGLPLLLGFVFQVYVLGTVESPGYGFGARRLASCAVLFVPGLAVLLDQLRKRPLAAPALLGAALVAANFGFMLNVRGGRLPATGAIRGDQIVDAIVNRFGNPFSMPANIWFALRNDTDLGHYERLGTQEFNNVRIDLGGAGDARFLARGWSAAERLPNGLSFRWSSGRRSSLLLRLREPDHYLLRVRAAAFHRPDGQHPEVRILVNNQDVGAWNQAGGFQVQEFALGPEMIRSGINRIVFQYSWTARPADFGVSDDRRQLAMQFDRIEMLRR